MSWLLTAGSRLMGEWAWLATTGAVLIGLGGSTAGGSAWPLRARMTLSGVRVAFTPSLKTNACLHGGSSPSRIGLVWASLRPCGRRTTLVIGPASSSPGSGGGQKGGLRVEFMVSDATEVMGWLIPDLP